MRAAARRRRSAGRARRRRLATIEAFRGRELDRIPTGPGSDAHLSFTVPGAVDAYLTLLETLRHQDVSEVLAPAVHYAERGFPMYEYMHRLLAIPETRSQFDVYPPGGTAVFYPGGRLPEVGELFVQPALAGTLRQASSKPTRSGVRPSRGRHRRRAAALLSRRHRGHHRRASPSGWAGCCAPSDLAGYRARLEPPVRMTFAGREIVAQAAWTQGPVLMQALAMLATLDLRALGHNSARYIHVVTEALKLAFADRERLLRRRRRRPDGRAAVRPPTRASAPRSSAPIARCRRRRPPAIPRGRGAAAAAGAGRRAAAAAPGVAAGGADGTTHIAAIDRDGNMVCLTPSGGVFRKSAFAPELGCTLSTRSEMFVLEDGHPNGLVPGKRPRTTLVSYLICEDGVPTTTVGCPGGDDQAQADLQIVLNLLVFGMNPQQAVEAPRFSTQTLVNSFWPRAYRPGQLNVEPGIPERTRAELRALGHGVSARSAPAASGRW